MAREFSKENKELFGSGVPLVRVPSGQGERPSKKIPPADHHLAVVHLRPLLLLLQSHGGSLSEYVRNQGKADEVSRRRRAREAEKKRQAMS